VDKQFILIVEGARGVGTTSFANYVRFHSQKAKDYYFKKIFFCVFGSA